MVWNTIFLPCSGFTTLKKQPSQSSHSAFYKRSRKIYAKIILHSRCCWIHGTCKKRLDFEDNVSISSLVAHAILDKAPGPFSSYEGNESHITAKALAHAIEHSKELDLLPSSTKWQLCQALQKAVQWPDQVFLGKAPQTLNRWLSDLKPGDFLILPIAKQAHVMGLFIRKQRNNFYTVAYFNTGFGIDDHPQDSRSAAPLVYQNIRFAEIVEPVLINNLFYVKRKVDETYEVFKKIVQKGNRIPTHLLPMYPKQSRGFCSYAFLEAIIQYVVYVDTPGDQQMQQARWLLVKAGLQRAIWKHYRGERQLVDTKVRKAVLPTILLAGKRIRVAKSAADPEVYLQEIKAMSDTLGVAYSEDIPHQTLHRYFHMQKMSQSVTAHLLQQVHDSKESLYSLQCESPVAKAEFFFIEKQLQTGREELKFLLQPSEQLSFLEKVKRFYTKKSLLNSSVYNYFKLLVTYHLFDEIQDILEQINETPVKNTIKNMILLEVIDQEKTFLIEKLSPAYFDPNPALHLLETEYPALIYAIEHNKKLSTEALLCAGADPNSKGDKLLTPLETAIYLENDATLQLLLKYEADPNHINAYGESPLLFALTHRNIKALAPLLQAGADPLLPLQNGTAIDHARKLNMHEALRILTSVRRKNQVINRV